jgi:hypothetical protein
MTSIVRDREDPGYGICRPMESRDEAAPSHRTWKTPARSRRRFPQLPQPLLPKNDIENPKANPKTNRHMFCKDRTRSLL